MSENIYYVHAAWRAREETPDALADRFVRMIDELRRIDPLLELWKTRDRRARKYDFEAIRDRYVEIVKKCISRDDFGDVSPLEGYWLQASTRGQPSSRHYRILSHVGAHGYTRCNQNFLWFDTSSMETPDAGAIVYAIFRPVLLAIVEAWEPEDCVASCAQMRERGLEGTGHFRAPWMQYLFSDFAALITPPDDVLVEHLPNGGLLMTATTETFDVDNPAHVAAAQSIGAATKKLNDLPYAQPPWIA